MSYSVKTVKHNLSSMRRVGPCSRIRLSSSRVLLLLTPDNAAVACAIRMFTSLSDVAVSVTVEPGYTNASSCSSYWPSRSTASFLIPNY